MTSAHGVNVPSSTRRHRRVGAIVFLFTAFSAAGAWAGTVGRAWEKTYAIPDNGRSTGPLASRQLADGSTMIVVGDGAGFSAFRYDADGDLLSAASFDAPGPIVKAQIGSFGEIAFAALTASCSSQPPSEGNLWIMKFDGFTGHASWNVPAVYGSDVFDGCTGLNLLLDASGDVVAEVQDPSGNVSILKYDGRTGVPKFAPIIFPSGLMGDITADAAGNLIAATTSLDANHDFETTKYDGQTGAVLWGPIAYDSGFDQDYAQFVAADSMGVVVAGHSHEADGDGLTLLKYDAATGATVWGPVRYVDPSGALPNPTGLRIDPSHDVVVSSFILPGVPSEVDFLLKYSGASGSLLWGPQPVRIAGNSNFPIHMTLTGSGDVVTDGVEVDGTNYNLIFRRFRHGDGTLAWGPTTNGPASAEPITLTSEGRLVLLTSGSLPNWFAVMALDADTGATVWTAPSPPPSAHGYTGGKALCVLPSGDVVVAGEGGPALTDIVLIRYAIDGTVVWGPVFYGAINDMETPVQVLADAAGDVIVLSSRFWGRTVLLKYSGASGALLWGPTEFIDAAAVRMALDPSGNVAVVMKADINVQLDFGTALVSGATGAVLWGPVTWDGGANLNDVVDDVAVLPSGNVVVAGRADAGAGPRAAVLAYSGASGALLWGPLIEPTIVNPGMRLAASAAGDVFLTGGSLGITTLKLSGSTGSVLWGPLSVSNGGGSDQEGLALAVDGSGDVIVAGALDGASPPGTEIATLKYAGSDGTLLWGPATYEGALSGPDAPSAVTLDGSGNAIVGGTARNPNGLRDVVTLKYEGTTGNLLWGPARTFTGSDQDFAGVTSSGAITFVGTSSPAGMVTTAYTEGLGVLTQSSDLPVAICGSPYAAALEAANGVPPYTWGLASGTPPIGLVLGTDGSFSGVPVQQGAFPMRAEVHDGTANPVVDVDVTLIVNDAGGILPIAASPSAASVCAWTLSVAGSYASYQWLPGGETSPTIDVQPVEPTTYGAILGDGSGCVVHAAVTIPAPRCAGPTLLAIAPRWGPADGGAAVTLTGAGFDAGATFSIGGVPASNISVVGATQMTGSTPALAPGQVYDVVVQNSTSIDSVLPQAFLADFGDVPPSNLFHDDVGLITLAQITAGCGGGNYCPNAPVTRAQMAVFLLKAMLGAAYTPPPASGTVFGDVPSNAFAADWIEDLYARGITGGCSASPLLYCPGASVTRAQMAVFLLKAEHGSAYAPPTCTGLFLDVPCPGGFAVDWIEQLSVEGVTAGCGGGNYCPGAPNTRGQMAVFLVKTFGLN